ncbi:MAG: DUF2073 domain-containing protein [Candidatus Pacearchaeota archaeon]|nr:DUF2073 domain-containing protein [Candidatus Pacearchaeota archaeon]
MVKEKKIKGLSLQLIPFSELSGLGISERVKKVLSLVLDNKIAIIQGRLRAEEEARLIEDTMVLVDRVKNFKGIELAVIEPDLKDAGIFMKAKQAIANSLTGNNNALTVVGPASIIKEIKRNPKKIELMLK